MVQGREVHTYGEFLVWIILWLMMATIQGFQRHCFWINRTIDPFEMDIYCLNDIFLQTRFKDILKELTITEKPPSYEDPFWELIHMIDVWNHNIEIIFHANIFLVWMSK